LFLGTFGTIVPGETDHDGNGSITAADFGIFLGKFSATGPANGTATLTQDQITALFARKYYVNVHTAQNTAGEIRGQIAPVALAIS